MLKSGDIINGILQFNQNFTVVSDKNYARIAIGSSNNTFSFVNDDFRCIILVDQNIIDEEESPFLNRFEKHIISFEYLLSKELINESGELIPTIKGGRLRFETEAERTSTTTTPIRIFGSASLISAGTIVS